VGKIEQTIKRLGNLEFGNLSSCTQYIVEVDLMWETGSGIIFDNAENPIPSLMKTFTTHPNIYKEVEITVIENGTDFISFKISGIVSST